MTALDHAAAFLREALGNGPRPPAEVGDRARRAGVSERTLERAKTAAGVISVRAGAWAGAGRWDWTLASGHLGGLTAPEGDEDDASPPPPRTLTAEQREEIRAARDADARRKLEAPAVTEQDRNLFGPDDPGWVGPRPRGRSS